MQKNEEYSQLVKEMEAENEGLLDEAGSKEVEPTEPRHVFGLPTDWSCILPG